MGFLNPLNLWLGLAAAGVAVPVIIHLLYRKNRKQTHWAAMELLRKALVVRSGQVKLEDFLILALRCLTILLIAGALLRPTLDGDSIAGIGERRVGMVVAIDASFSMSHGEHSRFERAVEKARQILATAQEGDPVTLLLLSSHPEILVRRSGYDSAVFDKVLDAQAAPSHFPLGLEQGLEQMVELVEELKTPVRECYVITDAQEADWSSLSGAGEMLLRRFTSTGSLFVVPVTPESENNLCLERLEYRSGSLRLGETGRFAAVVRNTGRGRLDGGSVELSVREPRSPKSELVARRAIGALEPGESRVVPFFVSFDRSGDVRLSARLSKDDLAVDNERYAVVPVRSRVRVLVADGGTSTGGGDLSRAGAHYAVHALRLRDRDPESSLVVSQVDAGDLGLENLSDFDVVLLADISDLAPELVDRLRSFVRRGGGLVVFLGDSVESELYNTRFAGGESAAGSLLPGKLGEVVAASAEHPDGWTLGASESDNPLAAVARRLPDGMLDTARVRKAIRIEPAARAEVLLRISETGDPLMVTQDEGAGSVVLVATAADRSWSDLPVHPLYAIVLQQAVTTLSSRPEARQFSVGGTLEVPVAGYRIGEAVRVVAPDGRVAEAQVTASGRDVVCAVEAAGVGVYSISSEAAERVASGGGDTRQTAVAVNVDVSESAVGVLDRGALETGLGSRGVDVLAGQEPSAIVAAIERSRRGRELASILLGLGVGAFLLQSFLAKRFTAKIHAGESDLGASLQSSQVAAARRS